MLRLQALLTKKYLYFSNENMGTIALDKMILRIDVFLISPQKHMLLVHIRSFLGDLIMKYFLWSFLPFCRFKKGGESAQ